VIRRGRTGYCPSAAGAVVFGALVVFGGNELGRDSGTYLFQLTLGGTGDTPVPGYYDNDTTLDPAVYHKANEGHEELGINTFYRYAAPGDSPVRDPHERA